MINHCVHITTFQYCSTELLNIYSLLSLCKIFQSPTPVLFGFKIRNFVKPVSCATCQTLAPDSFSFPTVDTRILISFFS
jgi:hypothetical protein